MKKVLQYLFYGTILVLCCAAVGAFVIYYIVTEVLPSLQH